MTELAQSESRGTAGRVLALLLLSLFLHGAVGFAMSRLSVRPAAKPPQETITIDVVEPPKPPPPAPPKPPEVERPKPTPARLLRAPRRPPQELPKAQQPPPPSSAPPPPTVEAKSNTPPVVLPGITLESTSSAGSFAVNTGNTLYGDPGRKGHAPSAVKPYKAEKYVAQAQVSELPTIRFRPDIHQFYPPEAKRKEVEGEVVLRVLIDDDGSVAKVEVLTDPGEGLAAAAVKAIRDFKFNPARLNGTAVATTITFTVGFEMHN